MNTILVLLPNSLLSTDFYKDRHEKMSPGGAWGTEKSPTNWYDIELLWWICNKIEFLMNWILSFKLFSWNDQIYITSLNE